MPTDLTPERLSLLDQARAEARDDLDKLVAHFAAEREAAGESAAVSETVQGLLDEPLWTRLELATALGEALARLTTTTERTPDDHRL